MYLWILDRDVDVGGVWFEILVVDVVNMGGSFE